jgi:hypothetical protein
MSIILSLRIEKYMNQIILTLTACAMYTMTGLELIPEKLIYFGKRIKYLVRWSFFVGSFVLRKHLNASFTSGSNGTFSVYFSTSQPADLRRRCK